MVDDYDMFTEKEVLEMMRSTRQTGWDECVLTSLICDGAITFDELVKKFPHFEFIMSDRIEKFRKNREEFVKIING